MYSVAVSKAMRDEGDWNLCSRTVGSVTLFMRIKKEEKYEDEYCRKRWRRRGDQRR